MPKAANVFVPQTYRISSQDAAGAIAPHYLLYGKLLWDMLSILDFLLFFTQFLNYYSPEPSSLMLAAYLEFSVNM
jgi:hypothetical protein